jgi:hypothetical protein
MSEKIQIPLSPKSEELFAENVGKFENLQTQSIDAMEKAKKLESELENCADQIVSVVMSEWDWPFITKLHEGRFSIRDWQIVMEYGFPYLYFTEVYDNEVKIRITPEVFHRYGRSEEVEDFLKKFIEYFRKRTNNKISIGMSPYVMAPRRL